MEDKVSIIIPAYNVEKYIGQCIESIKNQEYKNIEIIAIDDGSSDNTGLILEEYAHYDSRIRIIHKKNEGVSIARNTGLKESTGTYVIFVDGDDYLAEDSVGYLLDLAKKTKCDFCLSENCFTKKEEPQIEQDYIKVINNSDAVALLLSPKVIVGCWNKIYKKSFLIDNKIRFSTSLFYGEGLNFIINCAQNCLNVGIGLRKTYYYRRNNEQSATSKFNIEKYINGERALKKIKKSITVSSNKIEDMYNLHMCLFCLGAMTRIINNNVRNEYKKDFNHWHIELLKRKKNVIKSKYVSLYRKALITFGSLFPFLIAKLDLLRRNRIVSKSV